RSTSTSTSCSRPSPHVSGRASFQLALVWCTPAVETFDLRQAYVSGPVRDWPYFATQPDLGFGPLAYVISARSAALTATSIQADHPQPRRAPGAARRSAVHRERSA